MAKFEKLLKTVFYNSTCGAGCEIEIDLPCLAIRPSALFFSVQDFYRAPPSILRRRYFFHPPSPTQKTAIAS